ncbi:MAG: hypothetical protein B6D47_01670, partial [Rhodocyclaceae bacterium UTPRO2]
MYLEHFGLSEAPFRITPHTDFFFEGANRGATLEALLYAITHDEGIVKVSGEVGSGKTMLCRVLIERLPKNVETIHLANPSLSRDEILFTLADELQVNLATNRVSAVMRALQEHLIDLYAQGRQVVVLIDEAHAMPAETLEEIRLLSNLESNRHKLLQIVLFGQPELNEVLGRTEMRQLKERITHNFTLEPLVRSDVAQYIGFRMRAAGYRGPDVFSPAALKLISAASLGRTRRRQNPPDQPGPRPGRHPGRRIQRRTQARLRPLAGRSRGRLAAGRRRPGLVSTQRTSRGGRTATHASSRAPGRRGAGRRRTGPGQPARNAGRQPGRGRACAFRPPGRARRSAAAGFSTGPEGLFPAGSTAPGTADPATPGGNPEVARDGR